MTYEWSIFRNARTGPRELPHLDIKKILSFLDFDTANISLCYLCILPVLQMVISSSETKQTLNSKILESAENTSFC